MDTATVQCRATKADGSPCDSLPHLIHDNGLCRAHDPESRDEMRDAERRGGEATAAKNRSAPFTLQELPPLETLNDAMKRLDTIHAAVMMRRLTHAEGNAASKGVAEWVKAYMANITNTKLNELQNAHDKKEAEIAELRKQIAGQSGRPVLLSRVVS